jgi:hypothetical protein
MVLAGRFLFFNHSVFVRSVRSVSSVVKPDA